MFSEASIPTLVTSKPSSGPGCFPSTHWSVISKAGQDGSADGDQALASLCQAYWYPLYVHVRNRGYSPPDAQDLTQEFFAQLIGKRFLRIADPKRGRFRVFLRTALEYFLAKEWTRTHRQKRSGGKQFIFLDDELAENRYRPAVADGSTPDRVYDRQWALSLLERTMAALERECVAVGKRQLYERAQPMLSGDRSEFSYAELAAELQMSEGAFRVAVHRLRQRYGELLRGLVAETVSSPGEIEEEIHHLFAALRQ